MIRRVTILLMLSTAAVRAEADFDFTPTASEFVSEGMKYQKLTFHKDKQLVEYYPPSAWTFSGGPERIQLRPPKKNFAEAVIEAVPLTTPQLLDEKTTKALAQQLLATLPEGSQFVTVVREEQNPIPLDGKPTFEVTVSYQLMGEKFLRSALFSNLADAQIVFRLTAKKDDFGPLHSEFRRSIFSWHLIEAKEEPADSTKAAPAPDSQ